MSLQLPIDQDNIQGNDQDQETRKCILTAYDCSTFWNKFVYWTLKMVQVDGVYLGTHKHRSQTKERDLDLEIVPCIDETIDIPVIVYLSGNRGFIFFVPKSSNSLSSKAIRYPYLTLCFNFIYFMPVHQISQTISISRLQYPQIWIMFL